MTILPARPSLTPAICFFLLQIIGATLTLHPEVGGVLCLGDIPGRILDTVHLRATHQSGFVARHRRRQAVSFSKVIECSIHARNMSVFKVLAGDLELQYSAHIQRCTFSLFCVPWKLNSARDTYVEDLVSLAIELSRERQ